MWNIFQYAVYISNFIEENVNWNSVLLTIAFEDTLSDLKIVVVIRDWFCRMELS